MQDLTPKHELAISWQLVGDSGNYLAFFGQIR